MLAHLPIYALIMVGLKAATKIQNIIDCFLNDSWNSFGEFLHITTNTCYSWAKQRVCKHSIAIRIQLKDPSIEELANQHAPLAQKPKRDAGKRRSVLQHQPMRDLATLSAPLRETSSTTARNASPPILVDPSRSQSEARLTYCEFDDCTLEFYDRCDSNCVLSLCGEHLNYHSNHGCNTRVSVEQDKEQEVMDDEIL